uniref:Fringe-like glycosyltransferase domain-containing protein n=1 Tax=Pectinophora gossypiella TaxID=13191 RepID=A0A1E1WJH4_PECGO
MGGRTMIKAAAVLITLGYCSLLVYQVGATYNSIESRPGQVNSIGSIESRPGHMHLVEFDNVLLKTLSSGQNKTKTEVSETDENNSKKKPIKVLQLTESNDGLLVKPILSEFNNKGENKIVLSDIFISVKTSTAYENTRLPIILKTWFQLAKEQIWFFTDVANATQQRMAGGHIISTKCHQGHQLLPLCCKTAQEYDTFLKSGKKWFCHFDDDNYVNVPQLVKVLQRYDPQKDWYLGRNSISYPLKMGKTISKKKRLYFSFMFATFGAGVCISRSLALKMIPIASANRFIGLCHRIKMPDDVTMGYIIEVLVKQKLTIVPEFHSHLENLKTMNPETFRDQISLSYSSDNTVNVSGFDNVTDPTRIYSLHCTLFPYFDICRNRDTIPLPPTPTRRPKKRKKKIKLNEKMYYYKYQRKRTPRESDEDEDSPVNAYRNVTTSKID